MKRPAYIRENDAGVSICENRCVRLHFWYERNAYSGRRIQYLVQKGAILRKGQRIKTKFCKFSATPQGNPSSPSPIPLANTPGMTDRIFVAVLYTSDIDKVMRYTDEGPMAELCKWSVDLGMLPSFQMNAQMGVNPNGFYTEFELGLELDSAGEYT